MDPFKRWLDVVGALCAVVAFLPLGVAVAVAVKLDSKGPIFYLGVRVGYRGRLFRLLKFRTMVVDAERIGGASSANDDPRITRVGKFIRKYKLDELPQFLNVLFGDMSLVGPRPEVPQYVELFTVEERAILEVRPGITDWASLWNSDEGALLAGSPDPEKTYLEKIRPEKVRLQLEYVRKRSILTDLNILIKTAITVFGRQFGRK